MLGWKKGEKREKGKDLKKKKKKETTTTEGERKGGRESNLGKGKRPSSLNDTLYPRKREKKKKSAKIHFPVLILEEGKKERRNLNWKKRKNYRLHAFLLRFQRRGKKKALSWVAGGRRRKDY